MAHVAGEKIVSVVLNHEDRRTQQAVVLNHEDRRTQQAAVLSHGDRRPVKLCLHERLLAYLSPDTVTGDDGRHQNRCRGGCRLKWNMSQCLVRSDTVIYEAANQRPVDGLLLTFSLLSPTGAIFDAV